MGNRRFSVLSIVIAITALLALFQNCSNAGFQDMEISPVTIKSLEGCTDPSCDEFPKGNASCSFNGEEVPSGSSITAFLSSNADTCESETRTCLNGVLNGSYQFASCTPNAPRACLFNGRTIQHGESVTAFLQGSEDCESETRVCENGVLSGSYELASCTPNTPRSCLFDGRTIPSGSVVVAFQNSSVPFGGQCQQELRLCSDGTLNGSYAFSSCEVGAAASCLFNGASVPHLGKVTAYLASSVGYGQTCQSQERICQNGALSGSYGFASCNVAAPASCTFNGNTVPHGQVVRAFRSSSVAYGGTCEAQDRMCSNGVLSGTFSHPSCNVAGPATCQFNGTTIASGQSVTAFEQSSVAYGSTCRQQTRTCTNGALSGSYTFGSCSVGAPRACMFNGQTIAHGASVRAFPSSSVPFGSTCNAETRVCNDGSLSGSAAFASCAVAQPRSCLFNGSTIVHGDSVVAYAASSVAFGSTCQSERRACNNGQLSGTYASASCTVRPPDRKWVIFNDNDTHQIACARAGMIPSEDTGFGICAAGEARPKQGIGHEAIVYRHGTWGKEHGIGGTQLITIEGGRGSFTSDGSDSRFSTCYRTGQKKDGDRTDRAVAVYCKLP